MTAPLDIDHLRSWIGRTEAGSDVVTTDLVAKFRATLDLPGDRAKHGDPAPPLVHLCLAQPKVYVTSPTYLLISCFFLFS